MEQRKITSIVVVDGRRRASPASCTCTISGGRRSSSGSRLERRRRCLYKPKPRAIKLLLFDVDGVLTDGTVIVHADGSESKTFGIRDGIAMVWAQRAGLKVGLLSARTSPTTPHRAAQLGITLVHQGVSSKVDAYERILAD